MYSFSLVYLFLFHITMPPKSIDAKKEKAVWNDQETATLIEFLHVFPVILVHYSMLLPIASRIIVLSAL